MRRAGLAVVVIAASWLGWQWLFPSDEAQIIATLTRVAESLEGSAAADPAEASRSAPAVGGLGRLAALQNEFTSDAIVNAGPPFERLLGRQAIVGAAARIRVAARNLTVRFSDISVTVAGDRVSASASAAAEAEFDGADGRVFEARELDLRFSRQEGRWMIASVTMVQAMERLDTR
jgi:ketosteroid isomerase-like protein